MKSIKVDENSYIILSNLGKFFLYETNYEFKEQKETNIPVKIYEKIPSNIKRLVIMFKGNPYFLEKSSIIIKPRKSKKLKSAILPIKIEQLIPITNRKRQVKIRSPFVHLHIHTDHSLLDGVTKTSDYLKRTKELGMHAMAVTDHGNVSAHMELNLVSKTLEIKPIFGVETYIVKDATIHDGDNRSNNHIVLLAKDEDGYKNILALQKLSWSQENFYYRPRIDYKMLTKHRNGLVVLTACLKGLMGKDLVYGSEKDAYHKAKWLKKLFGNDLYLEIQLHNIRDENSVDIQKDYNLKLIKMAKEIDIKLVITNDVHYVNKGMHEVQAKVIRMKIDSDLSEAYCDSIWLKSYEEIQDTWKNKCKYIPKNSFNEAINSTVEIADKCNYEIPTGGLRIPKIEIKDFPYYKKGQSEEEYLRYRVRIGLKGKTKELFGDKKVYLDRIEREIDAFTKMEVISYILIFDDLIRHLKGRDCLCSLRGSANGSVVLWLIGMSIVDPIKFNILFERFISPARIEARMADIDIDLDISHTFRDEAIKYVKNKYGDDHICSVGSFGRTQLKAAVKNMARVEAFDIKKKIENVKTDKERKILEEKLEPFQYQEINKITKIMPDKEEDLEKSQVSEWFANNKKWFDKYVKPIIGNAYAESLHPAGIIVSPEPYHHWLPVRTNKLSADKGGERVFCTQWENSHTYEEYLNEVGATVLDILGVKNLTIINESIDLIKERHDKEISLELIPLDDKAVYKSLSKGENLGVFQLNDVKMKHFLRLMKPDNIEDIIFAISADRPGPLASGAFDHYIDRKHGREKITYKHPSMEAVVKDSLGVLVYSEHVMRCASEFAGMDAIKSEQMRKVIKSKNQKDFFAFKEEFIESAVKKWSERKMDEKRKGGIK